MKQRFFCVEGVLPRFKYECALAGWYGNGFLGSEELETEGDRFRFKVFFGTRDEARDVADSLQHLQATPVVTEIPQDDWNARWRQSMEPALLAPHWWVAPEWLPPRMETGDRWIRIEPKMAFGTGHHESTRLAAAALIEKADLIGGASVLDIGTGSGVLCFVTSLLGAEQSVGIEIDPDCRENLSENRELNGKSGSSLFCISGIEAIRRDVSFDFVIMNMIYTESAPLVKRCGELLKPGGMLIWSGILDDDHLEAVSAAEMTGFDKSGSIVENEWWCGIFTLPTRSFYLK
jgi:ribosomal protein L11 methyltransferase